MAEPEILRPGVPAYDEARSVWNAMIDRHPALVVRCRETKDVVRAVALARQEGLEVGVRCGGHSVVGMAVPEGGLMIDLTPMGDVRVDPERRRAWVQGGALLGALDAATQPHDMATTAGNVSHTGVGGLTLGGGMGWLARKHGLACDNVVSLELVTASGEVVRASADENAEDLDGGAGPARIGDDGYPLERRGVPSTELEVLPHRLALVLVELAAEDIDQPDVPVLGDGRVDRRSNDVLVVLLLHVVDRLEAEYSSGHVTQQTDHASTFLTLPCRCQRIGDALRERKGGDRDGGRANWHLVR